MVRCGFILLVASVAGCTANASGSSSGRPTPPPAFDEDAGARESMETPPEMDPRLSECANVAVEAESTVRPVDIVWVVDSSGSMRNEAARVQENMNRFAADILGAAIDPHVVVITSSEYVTVPPPLGTDPEHYRFVEEHVGSHEPLEALVQQWPRYGDFLRPDAVTHFVAVTDDESDMRPAEFDAAMLGLLGHPYTLHAIASENIGGRECPGAADPGDRYYELADLTMGLKLSICTEDWTGVFDRLREAVLDAAPLPCDYTVPDPPADLVFDTMRVNVTYTSGGGATSVIPFVEGTGACAGEGWHYDDLESPTTITLCGATCAAVSADVDGRVDIALGCQTILR